MFYNVPSYITQESDLWVILAQRKHTYRYILTTWISKRFSLTHYGALFFFSGQQNKNPRVFWPIKIHPVKKKAHEDTFNEEETRFYIAELVEVPIFFLVGWKFGWAKFVHFFCSGSWETSGKMWVFGSVFCIVSGTFLQEIVDNWVSTSNLEFDDEIWR